MARNDFCLYNGNHLISVFLRNSYSEEKNLSINLFDFGDKLQIKLRDLAEYSFNYMENLDMSDFELLRVNQCLDVNFAEFKTNLVDMLHQFQKNEMFLKCQLLDNSCSLIFFTKSKIKDIVYLTLDLRMTDQKEIIAEMHSEMHDLQDTNQRLQKQLGKAQKTVRDKELEVRDLDATRKLMQNQFCKRLLIHPRMKKLHFTDPLALSSVLQRIKAEQANTEDRSESSETSEPRNEQFDLWAHHKNLAHKNGKIK